MNKHENEPRKINKSEKMEIFAGFPEKFKFMGKIKQNLFARKLNGFI